MLRIVPVFILTVAFLAQTFNRAVIVSGYYANVYAKNCENKAKPQMHCNGKCQMMKKLNQEEKKDQQNSERRNAPNEVISSKSFFTSLSHFRSSSKMIYADQPQQAPVDRPADFFHPPGV